MCVYLDSWKFAIYDIFAQCQQNYSVFVGFFEDSCPFHLKIQRDDILFMIVTCQRKAVLDRKTNRQ
jgi:hypothetical protein